MKVTPANTCLPPQASKKAWFWCLTRGSARQKIRSVIQGPPNHSGASFTRSVFVWDPEPIWDVPSHTPNCNNGFGSSSAYSVSHKRSGAGTHSCFFAISDTIQQGANYRWGHCKNNKNIVTVKSTLVAWVQIWGGRSQRAIHYINYKIPMERLNSIFWNLSAESYWNMCSAPARLLGLIEDSKRTRMVSLGFKHLWVLSEQMSCQGIKSHFKFKVKHTYISSLGRQLPRRSNIRPQSCFLCYKAGADQSKENSSADWSSRNKSTFTC